LLTAPGNKGKCIVKIRVAVNMGVQNVKSLVLFGQIRSSRSG
jgi:hypothetical protein